MTTLNDLTVCTGTTTGTWSVLLDGTRALAALSSYVKSRAIRMNASNRSGNSGQSSPSLETTGTGRGNEQ